MMRKISVLLIACLILAILSPAVCADDGGGGSGSGSGAELTLLVNGEVLKTDSPPVIINDRVFLPLRAVTEAFGATVEWNEAERQVTVVYMTYTLRLTVGSETATLVSGGITSRLRFDAPAQIIYDRTYVPLRAVGEAFDADVSWDGGTRTVNVTLSESVALTVGDKRVVCGMTESELLLALGQPDRQAVGAEGLVWYSYNGEFGYIAAAVDGGRVAGFMTDAAGFSLSNGVKCGEPFTNNGQTVIADDRSPTVPAVSGSGMVYTDAARSYTMTVYRDEIDSGAVWAVRVMLGGRTKAVDTSSTAYCSEQSREIFDLLNGWRRARGLEPYAWESAAAECAYLHSDDMARNNYYDHVSPDGRTVAERYFGDMFVSLDENMLFTSGAPDALSMLGSWINSQAQRKNLVSEVYKYTGIGIAVGSSTYATQVFVAHGE